MKIPCITCSVEILPETHSRNHGRCTPCFRKEFKIPSNRERLNPFFGQDGFGCITHYFDASALIKYFLDEDGSDRVRNHVHSCLKARRSHEIVFRTTYLCFGETLGHVKNLYRRRKISCNQYNEISSSVLKSISHTFEIEEPRIGYPPTAARTVEIVHKYGVDMSDAFLIVAAEWIKKEHQYLSGGLESILVSADRDLIAAAKNEGVRVWDILLEATP
ncbi:MAG: type II toxin-antitoxin system VapC family toxin [Methyloversatilis sp.]|uniref:type II toxin-antitoxin system VapC family toxin n=1 Tax=Methyloversatilis sp. TaxID=2569862 RepID=UPI00273442D2|nr:type II toxin-antitoxin system VapC family toxin [Methyloversatilis sp.]MDP3874566.1 type II toxin-antitoxin system VapC family toxin [Methyloversatilis sp.]